VNPPQNLTRLGQRNGKGALVHSGGDKVTHTHAHTNKHTHTHAGFESAMAEAKERSRAGGKKAAGASIKFEAEATGWLQKGGIPLTVSAGARCK